MGFAILQTKPTVKTADFPLHSIELFIRFYTSSSHPICWVLWIFCCATLSFPSIFYFIRYLVCRKKNQKKTFVIEDADETRLINYCLRLSRNIYIQWRSVQQNSIFVYFMRWVKIEWNVILEWFTCVFELGENYYAKKINFITVIIGVQC